MSNDALLAALKSIADENGLDRIDIGFKNYEADSPCVVAVWFDAPEDRHACALGRGSTCDEAIAAAIDDKAQRLTAAPIPEAA